jgi:hypothetical protein
VPVFGTTDKSCVTMGYRELGLQYSGSDLEEPVDKEARLVCMSTGTVAGLQEDWHEVRQSRCDQRESRFFGRARGGARWPAQPEAYFSTSCGFTPTSNLSTV